MPHEPTSAIESLQAAEQLAREATSELPIDTLESEIAAARTALHGTESAAALAIPGMLEDVHEHAVKARGQLIAGVGSLAAYQEYLRQPKEGIEATATRATTVDTPVNTPARQAESAPVVYKHNNTPQPSSELALDISEEDFKSIIEKFKTNRDEFEVLKEGRAFGIPGHPDKVLRVAYMEDCTDEPDYTPEQNREHLRTYEKELARLHRAGVRMLRRATCLIDDEASPYYDGPSPALYTVVQRHPDTKDLQQYFEGQEDAVAQGQALGEQHGTLIQNHKESLIKYLGESVGITLGDLISFRQYALDSTLLDYDPRLLRLESGRHLAGSCKTVWDALLERIRNRS